MLQTILIPLAISFLVACLSIPVFRTMARSLDILDYPAAKLKSHARPVAYLGGGVVAIGVMAGLWAGLVRLPVFPPELQGLLIGAAAMFCIGLADDLKPLSPYPKLAFQFLATTLAILGGLHVSIQALPPALNYFLTYLWMLAMTNAFNIIDVHDGLCSGTAILISVGLLLVSCFTPLYDKTFVTVTAVTLLGALTAFFLVNRPPATMFLGDAGSLTIGFLLGGLAIGESYTLDHLAGIWVPFILFIIPIYDLVFVVVVRLIKGLSPIRGSPDHVAIRLRRIGWSDPRVLWSLLGLSGAAAALSPGVVFFPARYAAFLAGCTVLALLGIGVWLYQIDLE